MPADHALQVELERLADRAHREIEACSTGSVADLFSQEARDACAAITERLVQAGVDRKIAEWATTIWICGGREYEGSVWACKEKADYFASIGLIRPSSTVSSG